MKIEFIKEVAGVKKGTVKEVSTGRGARLIKKKYAKEVDAKTAVTPATDRAELIEAEAKRAKAIADKNKAAEEKDAKGYKKKAKNRKGSAAVVASTSKEEKDCEDCKEGEPCEGCQETILKHEDNIEIK